MLLNIVYKNLSTFRICGKLYQLISSNFGEAGPSSTMAGNVLIIEKLFQVEFYDLQYSGKLNISANQNECKSWVRWDISLINSVQSRKELVEGVTKGFITLGDFPQYYKAWTWKKHPRHSSGLTYFYYFRYIYFKNRLALKHCGKLNY